MTSANHRGLREAIRHGLRRASVRFTVGGYTLLSPFGCAILAGLAFLWRREPELRIRRLQRVTVFAYRFLHHWLRITDIARFDPRQRLEGLPRPPYVAIANHPSAMDITALFAVLGGGCTVVKSAVYRKRFLRPILAGAGHIEGPSEDLHSIGRIVDAALERLVQGFSIVVFPEGTRSPDHGMLPFGRAAFEIAHRARVPLVSIAVECDPLWLSKGVPLFRPPNPAPTLRLRILSVDDPATFGPDSRLLLGRAETRYRSWLESCSSPSAPLPPAHRKAHPCRIS